MLYNNILETIGNTPLIKINKLSNENIYAKVEFFNPGGSIKDRIAYNMIIKAKEEGLINDNTTLIEPTSGNTGIGLSMVCSVLNLKLIIVMPETMSEERRAIMKAYGAKLVLTSGQKGMTGAIEKAQELNKEIKNSFILQQFKNANNPEIHYKTTANEILKDLNSVDIFISGVGTGGTISGIGRKLKEQNKKVKIIAVEPLSSPFLTTGNAGSHKIQGIGAGFKPDTLDLNIIDEIITVSNEDAIETTKQIASKEGILVGISSGANMFAAIQESKKPENKAKTIVTIFPDTGERYLSSSIF